MHSYARPPGATRHVRRRAAGGLAAAAALLVGAAVSPAPATAAADRGADTGPWGAETTRVSVSSAAEQTDGPTYCCPTISGDGRYVAFESEATNLVPDDTNGVNDVFVHDRTTGETSRVSVRSNGRQANRPSTQSSISRDGRYVAFASNATNLSHPGSRDTNGRTDIFVHALATGETIRVSVDRDGTQARGRSSDPQLSADGRWVAFVSAAPNLVPGDTNRTEDVFVSSWGEGPIRRVSQSSRERQGSARSIGPVLSADARYVAYVSLADNLVPRDTNERADVFLRDRVRGTTERINLGPGGRQAQVPSPFDTGFPETISDGGRYVSFDSPAENLVRNDDNERIDVFVRDRREDRTMLVSRDAEDQQIPAGAQTGSMSPDGRQVVFWALSDGVTPGDDNGEDDLFVRNLVSGRTQLLTVGPGDAQADNAPGGAMISADGRHVAFFSFASSLVADDTNDEADIFVRSRTG